MFDVAFDVASDDPPDEALSCRRRAWDLPYWHGESVAECSSQRSPGNLSETVSEHLSEHDVREVLRALLPLIVLPHETPIREAIVARFGSSSSFPSGLRPSGPSLLANHALSCFALEV